MDITFSSSNQGVGSPLEINSPMITEPEMNLTIQIQITEPYLPLEDQNSGSPKADKIKISREQSSMGIPISQWVHTFLDIEFVKDIDNPPILKINKCCGGNPKKIQQLKDKTLLVQPGNALQAVKLEDCWSRDKKFFKLLYEFG